jgi:hypothetical protein
MRDLSLAEKEKDDEEQLLQTHSDLNKHMKNGDKSGFLNLLSNTFRVKTENSHTFLRNKILRNSNPFLENLIDSCSDEENCINFVTENFELYNHKLKCLVVGDSGVGKSQLITNFIKILNGERINKHKIFQYYHTESYINILH